MKLIRCCFALGLLCGFAALAQVPPPVPAPAEEGPAKTFFFPGGDFAYVRADFMESKLVKGAPYSAQTVTEFTQTLADGNHIHRSNTASIARDSEGRTRREESIMAIGPLAGQAETPKSIFIHDPVDGTSYILEPDSHTARQTNLPRVFRFTSEGPHASWVQRNTTVRIETRAGSEKLEDRAKAQLEKHVKTEDLGTQVMEGLAVQGKRETRTIPAGQIGNELPLQIVTESWYSPELQTLVMSKTSDPRTGESTYKLTNVSRAEPDPALFQVPADYTITEDKLPAVRELRFNKKREE